MKEKVSIIMPSYNTGKYIEQSIQSVIFQTHRNWELIIVDDCSQDKTDDIISRYLDDNRIKYIKNDVNIGAAQSRNKALKEAKGRWIAFLDSDDLWDKNKLKNQIEFMEQNKYAFSYTKYREINEQNQALNKIVTGPKKITNKGMYNYCWPGCLTVMYDTNVVGLVQIEDIKKNNDYAMWLKISKIVDCYLLDETLASYRRRNGSISNHSYIELIKWHYKLFREVEKMPLVKSVYYLAKNILYGIIKKIIYVNRSELL